MSRPSVSGSDLAVAVDVERVLPLGDVGNAPNVPSESVVPVRRCATPPGQS